ncbi:MAG: hypothetical protein CME71_04000 [Halobacteriovorax sp.]|nr:hypothetical protein [Halobacteriovorax sp.]|tara:strand:- start:303 stop:743 length:441 start_codon:yes stop_codon:yes gene_type:complete
MKTLIIIVLSSLALSATAFELKSDQSYVSKSKTKGCEDFILEKSENPDTPAWYLGQKIIFFEPGFKSNEHSNCHFDKKTDLVSNKWVQQTTAKDCEFKDLGHTRVEVLEQTKSGELLYTSEIAYDDQKDQVQRLSCRFVKKASKAN